MPTPVVKYRLHVSSVSGRVTISVYSCFTQASESVLETKIQDINCSSPLADPGLYDTLWHRTDNTSQLVALMRLCVLY